MNYPSTSAASNCIEWSELPSAPPIITSYDPQTPYLPWCVLTYAPDPIPSFLQIFSNSLA